MSEHITETGVWKTAGLDVGDRSTFMVVLDEAGEVAQKTTIRTTKPWLERTFGGRPRMRIALEAGTHSHWMAATLAQLGHDVVMADPRRLEMITKNERKSDERDARMLAELAHAEASLNLLSPVRPKTEVELADRGTIKMRSKLVQARVELVLNVRGIVKAAGCRLPTASTASFHSVDLSELPKSLAYSIGLMLPAIKAMTQQIKALDKEIERIAKERYPQTTLLREIKGVGPITSLLFVLTIGEAQRFKRSRDVGAYLGLVPRRQQSGSSDPQLRVTKAGDRMMRSLLVQCAHYILGPHGGDSDLRQFGERIAKRGGRYQKKRAVIAVARKLAVVMHRLWVAGEVYDPLRNAKPTTA